MAVPVPAVNPKRWPIAPLSSGTETANAEAVPAITAKIESRSRSLPQKPSTRSPSRGRQASLSRRDLLPRTCSIKPNAAASTR